MDSAEAWGDPGVEGEQLEELDELVVECKASGFGDAETGALLGVSSKTVQRHRNRPAVRAAIAVRKADRVSEITALLGEAGREAVAVLLRGLDSLKDADRIRAATCGCRKQVRLCARASPGL